MSEYLNMVPAWVYVAALAALLPVAGVYIIMRFRSAKDRDQFIEEQKRRAVVCLHGKRRGDCFMCVGGGRPEPEPAPEPAPAPEPSEATKAAASFIDMVRAQVEPLTIFNPAEEYQGEYALQISTDATWGDSLTIAVLSRGRLYNVSVVIPPASSCYWVQIYHHQISKIILSTTRGITAIALYVNGQVVLDSTPEIIREVSRHA